MSRQELSTGNYTREILVYHPLEISHDRVDRRSHLVLILRGNGRLPGIFKTFLCDCFLTILAAKRQCSYPVLLLWDYGPRTYLVLN